jgi:alpha-beta hydrolase superfamily lysophospholipase
LRGNGKSDGKRGHFDSIDQIMDDIHFLVQETKKMHPGLPIILYSQSMGGNLAINFTLRYPSTSDLAIISSPWLRLSKQPSKFILKVAFLLGKIFPSLLIPNGLKSKDLCHDEQICYAYDTDPLIHWRISVSAFNIINFIGEWAIKNGSKLSTPMLVLHSEDDPITSFGASNDFCSNSNQYVSFIPYKNLFHELHNDPEKQQILNTIIEWINSSLPKI